MMRRGRDRYPHDECDRTGVLIICLYRSVFRGTACTGSSGSFHADHDGWHLCAPYDLGDTCGSSRNLRAGHHLLSDHMGGRCACDEHLLHLQAEKNISGKIATKIREYIRETYLLFILIMNRFLFSFIAKLIKCKLNCEKSTKA